MVSSTKPTSRGDSTPNRGVEGNGSPQKAQQGKKGDPRHQQVVNTSALAASNREQRRREAEEDRVLIKAIQNGDQAAFRKLVQRHQGRVFAIALGIVRDENDAREISQEAFLRVYKGLDRFKGGSSFFTWIYRIVTNLSIDLMRRPGRRDAELVEDRKLYKLTEGSIAPLVSHIDGSDPVRMVRRKEIVARLREALDALPPYHRGVILMREVEGMSYEEMAQAMGVSKGTIMSRLFHARQKLQKALKDCYEEEKGLSADSCNSSKIRKREG
ncbi:MAG: RNA polymerase subunit sigma [Sorangium cellulosum]|nr:MAG: RNA polymerase subunit sigma [Sorangium cellulosum]